MVDEFDLNAVPDNFVAYIRSLEARISALEVRDGEVGQLSDLANDAGEIRAGQIIAGEGDPYGEGDPFTGAALLYPPATTPNGDSAGIVGGNAGLFEFWISYLTGRAAFARGTAVLSKDGILMTTGNPMVMDDGNDIFIFGSAPGVGIHIHSFVSYNQKSLTNASFETGDLTDWVTHSGTPSVINSQAQDGVYSCSILGAAIRTNYLASTAHGVLVDFWVYSVNPAGVVTVAVENYNGSFVALDGESQAVRINSGGIWQRFTLAFEVQGASQAYIRAFITGSSGSAAIYVDNFRILDSGDMFSFRHSAGSDSVSFKMTDGPKYALDSGGHYLYNKLTINDGLVVNNNAGAFDMLVKGTSGNIINAVGSENAADILIRKLNIKRAGTVTIAAGAISTGGYTYLPLETESAAATDDLDTINGGSDGDIVILRPALGGRTITAKDNTGNLQLAGDFAMDNPRDSLTLQYRSDVTRWCELARSNNA